MKNMLGLFMVMFMLSACQVHTVGYTHVPRTHYYQSPRYVQPPVVVVPRHHYVPPRTFYVPPPRTHYYAPRPQYYHHRRF